ncbi:hypothetical protein, partial [Vibrio vulnificus]|uniref:hypothetical protein n=1 Tax=Vibrio vulnificus TaxID=672 RepID=UPI003D9CA234
LKTLKINCLLLVLSSLGHSLGFSANQRCLLMRVLSYCLNGVLGLREVRQFGAKSLWRFCFRFEFSESDLSKFSGFQIA